MPFTIDEFLGVFANYNETIWPFQFAFYAAAFIILYLIVKRKSNDKIISGLLAFFWVWTGTVYHIIFFAEINPVAYLFGSLFIIQGILFIRTGFLKKKLEYGIEKNLKLIIGAIFILYALAIYPIIGTLMGHVYPAHPTFGLPCPTTIFTFGILLFASKKVPIHIIIIPLIWSFIGISAAINLGIKEDLGLIAAGVIGSSLLIYEHYKNKNIAVS